MLECIAARPQRKAVAHHDCVGNPVSDREQRQHFAIAESQLTEAYPDAEVTSLWLKEQWIVERTRTK